MRAFMMFVIMLATTVSAHRKAVATTAQSAIVDLSEENSTFNKLVKTSALITVAENATLTDCKYEEPPQGLAALAQGRLRGSEQLLAIVYGDLLKKIKKNAYIMLTYDPETWFVLAHWFQKSKKTKSLVSIPPYCADVCPSCKNNFIPPKCVEDEEKKFKHGGELIYEGRKATLINIATRGEDPRYKLELGTGCYLDHVYAKSTDCRPPEVQCRTNEDEECTCGVNQPAKKPTSKKTTSKNRQKKIPQKPPQSEDPIMILEESSGSEPSSGSDSFDSDTDMEPSDSDMERSGRTYLWVDNEDESEDSRSCVRDARNCGGLLAWLAR